MRVLHIVGFGILIVGSVLAQQQIIKTPEVDLLSREVHGEGGQPLNAVEAFRRMLGSARVPGGVASIAGCQPDEVKKKWKMEGKTLGEILNELTSFDSRYRWEIHDGTINLLPTSGEPVLLQTQIGVFEVKTDSSFDALEKLKKRREVADAMNNLHFTGGLTIVMHLSNSKEFSLDFKGGTLREALNAIALGKGADIWSYQETHCGDRNEVSIKF